MLVTLVGLVMAIAYAVAELVPVGWDPAGVIAVGEDDPVRIEYATEVFGRDIPLAEQLGHDGKFFFIQAMDPLLLHPDEHAVYLDRPTYRAQRMFYPLLASLGRPLGPTAVAWAMIVVNVIAFAVGTLGTAMLARSYDVSPWWGLAFVANPGVRFEADIFGGGVIAMAALMWALVALVRNRLGWSLVGWCIAVLSREAMLVAAFGAALARGVNGWRKRAAIVVVPGVVGGAWWVYAHWRLAGLPSGPVVQEIGSPFGGFFGAFELWLQEPGVDMVIGITYLALSVITLIRAVRIRSLLEMPAAGFALVAFVLTRQVWFRHYDISRALSPMVTLLLLSLAVSIARAPNRVETDATGPPGGPA